MQTGTELRALTSARGIAAWFVVFYHIRSAAMPTLGPELAGVFAYGYLAVDFFFMLSGFVIWLNYADRLRAQGLAGVPTFLQRRLARVYPLHFAMLCAALLFVAANWLTGRGLPDGYPLAELPYHLLLIQNWGLTEYLSWNDPAWSISCELAAYLVFPLLVMLVDWRKFPTTLLIVIAAALFLILHGVMAAAGETRLGADIPRFGLLRCLTQFAVGSILCALWLRWRERPFAAGLTTTLAGAVALVLFLFGLPETLLIPVAFACLLLALALTADHPLNPLRGKLIHYLGEISYATYLVHFLLFVAFKLAFVSDAHDIGPGLLIAFLGLTLIASIGLYHLVERPTQRWLNGRGAYGVQRDSTISINAAVN